MAVLLLVFPEWKCAVALWQRFFHQFHQLFHLFHRWKDQIHREEGPLGLCTHFQPVWSVGRWVGGVLVAFCMVG
jgi:hypothetical protein